MQYHVPQFLEVEDKVFGFITMKQFLYILGSLAVSYLAYTYLKIYFALPLIVLSISFGVALAFYRPYNKPFMFMVEAFLTYFSSPRLYIWKKEPRKPESSSSSMKGQDSGVNGAYVPPLSESNLKDLAWSLDIKDKDQYGKRSQISEKGHAPLLKDL
ncbi:MAG: PrgI family protein [Candidatus Paceibacterota bacterium]|jgi:hypothetical protein|nr:PrgI family protein [Candidatus Paceibacterota bacterium]